MNPSRALLTTAAATLLALGSVLTAGSIASAADDVTPTADASVAADPTAASDVAPDETSGAAAADAAAGTPKGVLPPAVHDRFGSLKVTPAGPYKNGQKVTYTFAGFPANTPVVGSICIADVVLAGPQDCGSLNGPHTGLGVADSTGKGSLTLTVVEGKLGATAPAYASYTCGNGSGHGCLFSLSDYSDNGPAKQRIVYATTASSTKGAGSSSGSSSSSSTSGSTGSGTSTTGSTGTTTTTASTGSGLAATGAGTARTSALAGIAMLLGGAFLLTFVRRPERESSAG